LTALTGTTAQQGDYRVQEEPMRFNSIFAAVATAALSCVLTTQGGAQDSVAADPRLVEARATQAVIWGMPVVNYDLMRQEMLSNTAAKVGQVVFWGKPLDWHNQTLTPNPDTLYFMAFFNTKDGPVVIDVPAASSGGSLNANIVNAWQQPLEDAGQLGADQGKGGRFVVLPPGYTGTTPENAFVLHSETYGGYALIRSNLKSHADADVASSAAYAKQVKVYPLSQAASPPETVFVDAGHSLFDSTIKYDASFFANLDRVVQEEPWIDRDRVMIDILKSIGIEKGKPFQPDAVTTEALTKGVQDAHAALAALYDRGLPPYFEGTHWSFPAYPDLIKATQAGFQEVDAYPVDYRGLAYSYAYIGIKRLGAGQFYLFNIKDKDGDNFDGAKTYRLHVPPGVPVKQYWSLTAYDRETHALIKNVDRASRASNSTEVKKNGDGSVDLYLGPKVPEGKDSNWIPTDPNRGFELIFRLYGPTQALFDKKWTLPDIEKFTD
jgi:hypothetical protein